SSWGVVATRLFGRRGPGEISGAQRLRGDRANLTVEPVHPEPAAPVADVDLRVGLGERDLSHRRGAPRTTDGVVAIAARPSAETHVAHAPNVARSVPRTQGLWLVFCE